MPLSPGIVRPGEVPFGLASGSLLKRWRPGAVHPLPLRTLGPIVADLVIALVRIVFGLEDVIPTPMLLSFLDAPQLDACLCHHKALLLGAGAVLFRSPFSKTGGDRVFSEGTPRPAATPVCNRHSIKPPLQ